MPIGKFFTSAGSLLEDFGKKINSLDMEFSLEELLNIYGDVTDKIILREEDEKNCSYIGGEFRIACADDEKYQCAYTLYFEDADETVHTVEAQTKPLEMKFLTEDFQRDLKKAGTLKFELDEPSEEARKKYAADKKSHVK